LPADPLLAYYRRQAPDDRGRTLDQIRALGTSELERVHDYIQWLFPLAEPSGANPSAPVLAPETIAAFRSDETLRRELLESFATMLTFYGFRLAHATTRIERAPEADARLSEWFRPGNHNFLRLTRIMRSMSVLGLPEYARALLGQLEQLYSERPQIVGDLTIDHWRRAAP
jgi:hypothetical protein